MTLKSKSKIEQTREYEAMKPERHYKAVYLNALRTGNAEKIAHCESFGSTPRRIIVNMRAYDTALKFGIDNKILDEYGWLMTVADKFFERENIEFVHQKGHCAGNIVVLQKAPNGLWVVGLWFHCGDSGGAHVPGIWARPEDIFSNRSDAIIYGLKELLRIHGEAERPEPRVVRDATAMLKGLTTPQQQTLF